MKYEVGHPSSVLEFERVALEASDHLESMLCDVSFSLPAAGFLLVLLDRAHLHLPLASAASGLILPAQGNVRFNGKEWRQMGIGESASNRGRIGRLFDEDCWVANLDMDENLTLAQRHHTRRNVDVLREEAADLSRQFLLPGMPLGKPDGYRTQDLQKAACVRALMGQPELILLERPTQFIYADILAPLVNAVYAARRRGAAVIWTTENRRVWDNAGLNPSLRARVSGARLEFL